MENTSHSIQIDIATDMAGVTYKEFIFPYDYVQYNIVFIDVEYVDLSAADAIVEVLQRIRYNKHFNTQAILKATLDDASGDGSVEFVTKYVPGEFGIAIDLGSVTTGTITARILAKKDIV